MVIRASQTGNDLYKPAAVIERSFEVKTVLGLEKTDDMAEVFPNPAHGQFTVRLPQGWFIEDTKLFSSMGMPVSLRVIPASSGNRVEVQNIIPGIYLLHLQTNKGKIVKRMIFK